MVLEEVKDALTQLTAAFVAQPELEHAVGTRWHSGGRRIPVDASATELPKEVSSLADRVAAALPALSRSESDELGQLFNEAGGRALSLWCSASTWRRDADLAPLLEMAARSDFREHVPGIARDRVIEGPLADAIVCAPLMGDGSVLMAPENAEALARLEILIWEAGSSALEVPRLGQWVWGSPATFDAMIAQPAHGTLLGRVLAARCLEISARGMPRDVNHELVGRTLQLLQPLLLHPEPLVWVHAARALGRLTASLEQLENNILDWVLGESTVLKQRAMTAFASLPADRLRFLASQLIAVLDSPDEEAWVLAAVAAATPYLFFERRVLWDRLANRILAGDGGAIAARALARGLATIWRRGKHLPEIEQPLRSLRNIARETRAVSLDELRRWIEVVAVTDIVDGAERDPLDLELGIENLMRIAAQYDDEEADARAARFASSLAPTIQEARRIVLAPGRMRPRAAAINALEGCARALALRLWSPL
ncbi:MAG: hypothetical protein JNK04_10225, partial [Myxococcales bacterium]|nr:hypothetical protein [Myxococcales bacterium]